MTALLPPATVHVKEVPTVPEQLGVAAMPLMVTPEKISPAVWPATTPWLSDADVDAEWFVVPAYAAVTDRVTVVVHVATPDAPRVCVPDEQLITVEPSLKVTVPVGTPPPGAVAATVAV